MKTKILNSKGEPIVLNAHEARVANALQNELVRNALGYEIDITSLTAMIKSVTEQKFFRIAPNDFVPVIVGEGAWSSNLVKYRSFQKGQDFEAGNLNTGTANNRLAEVDASVDSVTTKIINWGKQINWSLMDLQQAAKSGNWDLVTSKEKSRKTNWDLGIQEICFIGSATDADVEGLLNMTGVTSDTAIITKYIKDMSASEFQQFLSDVYEAYRENSDRTAEPTNFIIPEADFNGLGSAVDETYNMKSRLQRLEENFKLMTGNDNFKIQKLAYADKATNAATINKNRYVMLNKDEDTLRMSIPVDYTATMANSVNSFQFQNVGYGQYTGVELYRPKEVLYFDF